MSGAGVLSILGRTLAVIAELAIRILPQVLGVVVLCFFLLQLLPGDIADVLAAQAGSATAETMAAMRERFGLDQPVMVQLWVYLQGLAHLDLGYSQRFSAPVLQLILSRLPATLALMLLALGVAVVVGTAIGWVMARYRNKVQDRLLSVLVLIFYSTPGFWMGLMGIILFSVHLGWLPDQGSRTVGVDFGFWRQLWDYIAHLILPVLSLSGFYMAVYARLARATILEIRPQDYVRTAVAKGLPPRRIEAAHVMRNALLPVITMAGLHIGNLLGGSIVVEMVFGWPGMGRLAFEAITGRDYPLLLGVLLMSSVLVIVINQIVDVVLRRVDPRLR